MNKKKFYVMVGFATGNPATKNTSWFIVEGNYIAWTKKEAIEKARTEGYRMSDDICADWVFRATLIKEIK